VGDTRRTKAELTAELEALRKQIASLTETEDAELPRALDALRESEARFRRLTENALDLIGEVDAEGRILFVSPNCETLLGNRAEDVVGLSIRDALISGNVHPDDREPFFEGFVRAGGAGGEAAATYRYRHQDGSWRWLDSKRKTVQTSEGEWRTVVISRDVTEREEAQQRLRQSEERYRMLAEATHDLVAELDAEGRVVFVSPSCEKVLGYKPEEVTGTTPFGLLHPDDVEYLAELFLKRLTARHPPSADHLFRARHRDGSWRWLQGGGVNFRTLEGETHIVSVTRDVTDRLRAAEERRKLEEWVQQAQKLESLGMLAGGVAHDFNNLLTPILGDTSLALMDLPPDSPVRPRLHKIQRAAHQAATLTNQLLDYAGIGSLDTELLDISKLAREMGQLLQSAVSKKAKLGYELADGLPAVEADAAQISQVVMNLITNASAAIEARSDAEGRIAIRSGTVEADRKSLSQLFLGEGLPDGTYVYFEVEDDGCGMSDETRARIFDPFFTTKFTGRGLGLAAVLGIVRKHGGAIEIESEVDRGTRIRVLCPTAGRTARREAARRQDPAAWRAEGIVLVADDDEGVRDLLTETLERAGLTVLCATDGSEAVETFRQHAKEIRLVLLDRTMPGASGEEALDGIQSIRPDVPVVLVSGYSQESSAQRFASKRLAGFLHKPFLPETLLEKVRELLEN
jgi:PAS domain S-box-containing protein